MKKVVKIGGIVLGSILVLLALYFFVYRYFFTYPTPSIKSITLDDKNNIKVKFTLNKKLKHNKIYCIYKTDDKYPKENDKYWMLSKNNECNFELNSSTYNIYLKNEKNKIIKVKEDKKLGKVTELKINKEQVYLAINGNYSINYEYKSIGYIDEKVTYYSDDNEIATIDENGKITGLKLGSTKVHVKMMNAIAETNVLVTDVITVRPKTFNSKKTYLPCNKYSKEQNDLLDTILVDRMNDVGYPTRASAVEAARFLTLEFPYKIRYFSENGRGSTNGIDGEGRYYHKGLYLDESRFASIGKKSHGPKTWGCSLYSNPSHGQRPNGLDCSGFITWVMYNGGWDVKDVGAGLASHLDMTDYGVRTKFNADVVKSGKVKVGDLLSSGGVQGGHIAMIVGQDENNYYVAESLWTPPNVAVGIYTYSKKTVFNRYYYVMLMDSYYKEDGKLTDLWY